MTKTIKGNLILKKDTIFNESIIVEGNIKGYYNLKVIGNIDAGNIDAGNIDAGNIKAGNIEAWDIKAWDIDAWNIDARNIDAWDIIIEKRIKKTKTAKTICRVYITNKSKLERKERGNIRR